ncbi:MAG TPA: metalloregulator ArsR/SmtB family transcription factor [Stellaceae bacterium]|nr:metalloregulator ArsR/SmtB family transcription factor [Stellaceae bacterium]
MEHLLAALRAIAEPTRLRLVALCAHGSELTVSELTQILGQSQPRVSRHLKLLCEAAVLERFREGSWVFYRLSQSGPVAGFVAQLVADCDEADPALALDIKRLAAIKRQRADLAADYFRANAARWHRIRSLYIDEREVEAALIDIISRAQPNDLLDIGTGTGRMLEILAGQVGQALGIDQSREMLALARVNLERAGLRNARVRLGDMYQLALADASFDAIVIHQVLHYADRPAAVITEAARVLRPRGILVLVDFAPHDLEFLREEHAHRRLGFADGEIAEWCRAGGLDPSSPCLLPGDPLTVAIWTATRGSGVVGRPSASAARGVAASALIEGELS